MFGYGSLVWNPLFHFEEKRVVTTHGYHRSFCLWSRINRGTPDRPGLVLGLDRGGRCRGVAYRIAAGSRRERTAPRLAARNDDGRLCSALGTGQRRRNPFRAITFTINRAGAAYAGRLPPETVIERLMSCHGRMGPGIDYLLHTAEALRAHGIEDRYLQELCDRAQAIKARDWTACAPSLRRPAASWRESPARSPTAGSAAAPHPRRARP